MGREIAYSGEEMASQDYPGDSTDEGVTREGQLIAPGISKGGNPGTGRFTDRFVSASERIAPKVPIQLRKILGLSLLSAATGQKVWMDFHGRTFFPNAYFIFLSQWADKGLHSWAKGLLASSCNANVVDQDMFGTRTILRGLQEGVDTFEHKRLERTHSHCSAVIQDLDATYLFSEAMTRLMHNLFDIDRWSRKGTMNFQFVDRSYHLMNPCFSMCLFTSRYVWMDKLHGLAKENNLAHLSHFFIAESSVLDGLKYAINPTSLQNMSVQRHLSSIAKRIGPLKATAGVRGMIKEYIRISIQPKLKRRQYDIKGSIYFQHAPSLYVKLCMLIAMDKGHWMAIQESDVLEAQNYFNFFSGNMTKYLKDVPIQSFDSFDVLEEIRKVGKCSLRALEQRFRMRGEGTSLSKTLENLIGMNEIKIIRGEDGKMYFLPKGTRWDQFTS